MKNKIRSFIAAVLLVSCVFGVTACGGTKTDGTGTESVKPTDTEEAGDTDAGTEQSVDTTPVSAATPSLSGAQTGATYAYYIRLDGIEGDSRNPQHEKWISVIDFSYGASRTVQTGVPLSSDHGTYEPIVFTHAVDKATPLIQRNCMSDKTFDTAEFHIVRTVAGQETVICKAELKYLRFAKAEIKTVTAADGTTSLVEEVTMFAEVEFYTSENDTSYGYTKGLSYYVKLDGFDGGCDEAAHAKWIPALGFSHGSEQELYPDSQMTTGNGTFLPVSFTQRIDNTTGTLLRRCYDGYWINSGTVDVTKSIAGKSETIYTVKLEKIKLVKVTVRSVTDENGFSYPIAEVSALVNKEAWTVSSIGLDISGSGKTEAEFDQTRKA